MGERDLLPQPKAHESAPAVGRFVVEERRILVVDDEADVLKSTCELLESLGCQPIPLEDPGEVLPMARLHRPALILQDLRMPDLNVAGLVAALRSDPWTQDIPIVFFSANADVAATAQRYDAWGFLRKPFSVPALEQVLRDVFGQSPPEGGIRDIFHEQWNVISAMANYAHLLRTQVGDPAAAKTVKNLQAQLLRLEASIDRLHVFVSKLAAAQAPPERPERPPRPVRRPGTHDAPLP